MADKADTSEQFNDSEMYRAIFENSLTSNLILSNEGEILKANPEACNLFGYDENDLKGTFVSELLDSNDIVNIQNKPETYSGHAIGLKANGTRFVCNVLYSVFESQSGEKFASLQINENSERSKEIENLKLFESVVKDASDAVVIIQSRPSGRSSTADILFVNEAYTNLTGYNYDELIGEEAKFLNVPKSSMRDLARLRIAIERNESIETELLTYKKNGEEFWVHVTISPVFDGDICTHFIAIAKDVTERKNREQLRFLETDISRIFNNHKSLSKSIDKTLDLLIGMGDFSLVELWIADEEKKTISMAGHKSADKNATIFYDISADIQTFTKGEGLPGITWDTGKTQFWRDLKNQQDFIRKSAAANSEIKTAYGIPVRFDNKITAVLVLGVTSDQQKRRYYTPLLEQLCEDLGTELNRKKTEEQLDRIFSFSPDIICVAGMDGYFKQVNPAMSRLLGYSQDELLSQPIPSFTHPDDRLRTEKEIDALNMNKGAKKFQNRYITKSGKVVWLSWTTRAFFDEGKIYSIARDITEQKELEILLRQANRLAKIGAWEYDVVEETVVWSEVVRQIHEVPADFNPNLEEGLSFYKEGYSRDMMAEKIKNAIEKGESFDVELQIVTGKDNIRWVRVLGEVEVVQGRVKKIYGSFQDIHDRKSVEERLKKTTDNLPGIIFQYLIDPDGNDSIRYLSEGANDIWGISAEEAMENTNLIWDRIDGRDISAMKESISESAETLTKWHHEWRYRHPDGSLRWQDGYGTPIKLVDGSILWDSIILDITEKKEIEKLLEQASDLAKIGSWEVDLQKNDNEMYWSEMTREILEVEDEENASLQRMLEFYEPQSQQKAQDAVDNVLENGGSFDLELLINTAKGRKKWIRSIGEVEYNDGEAVRIYGSYQDIHARKKIEEKLKDKTRHLEVISKLNSALLNYEDWFKAIDENLEIIGRAVEADRAYYFENHYDPETGEGFTTEKLEWNKEGITPQLDNPEMESVPFSEVPELVNPLMEHKPSGGIISKMPESSMTRHVMEDQDIKAFLAIPVIVNGNFHGFLGFDNCTNEEYWSREEETMVKTIASNLATAIERSLVDRELENLLNERNTILESISDAFYSIGQDWKLTYFNQEAKKLIPDKHQEVIGRNVWDVFELAEESKLYEKCHEVMSSGTPLNFEYFYERLKTWFDVSVYPSANGISVYFKNINDRKKAQTEILKKTSQLDTIAIFNGLLIKLDEWVRALEECLEPIGEISGADRVYFFECEKDTKSGIPKFNMHLEWVREGVKPELKNPVNQNQPVTDVDYLYKHLSKKKVLNTLVSNISDKATRDLLEKQDIKSILIIPVFAGKEFQGFIGFDNCSTNSKWDDDEIEFLKTICLNLGSAIENEQVKESVQKALTEKKEILESIGDAFFAVDHNWIVTYWNNVAEDELGMPREKIVGENLWDIYEDATDLEFYTQYHIAMNRREKVTFEDYYPAVEKWFEVSVYPSNDGLSIFFKDITHRKETEERMRKLNTALKKQTEELAASNAELEQFAFVASHDLQEPLRMVTSFLTQLEKKYGDELDEKAKKYIWFATDGAKRMRQIILDLLNYSRIGRTETEPKTIALNEMMEVIMRDFQKTIEETNAEIHWGDLPEITADYSSIQRVLRNIVGNALKYRKENEPPKIVIEGEETKNFYRVSIKDNGIGIAPEYQDKIFQIFQRLHSSSEYSGTGIGLAICRKIIENVGGDIEVTSEVDKGSTFTITIPKPVERGAV